MTIDIPTSEDFSALTRHRDPASISLYISAARPGRGDAPAVIAQDSDAARLRLRSAAGEAISELAELGIEKTQLESMRDAVRDLEQDREFWATQGRTLAVFVSPAGLRAFRLMNDLPQHVAVGDRFDVGPLVRATTFAHNGYVLAVTEGAVRLIALDSDASSHEVELALAPDAADALDTTVTSGRFDRHRADGTLGPKVGQRRYCAAVQDAVLAAIGSAGAPLVLAAAADLEPAYREVNSYQNLLETGIDANPASLSREELESRARVILAEHYASGLAKWRERFGSLRAHGRASSQLSDVAHAASAGLVDTLLFDLESTEEGTIDDAGSLTLADAPGPTTYGLVDELVARVLRTGGTVMAVREEDLPDDSPVAATFRSTP